jgi:hypothetical protein
LSENQNYLNRFLIILDIFLLLFLPGVTFVEGQNDCLRGRVFDGQTGQAVSDAHVWENILSEGAVTDSSGNFRICLPDDFEQAVLTISHTSYKTHRIVVKDFSEEHLVFKIEKKDLLKSEVQVLGRRKPVINKVLPGQSRISGTDIARMPTLLGESDVVRTLQQMSGTILHSLEGDFLLPFWFLPLIHFRKSAL